MTIIDGLTQAHNKRYLLEALEREIIRARRHERELSFLMFDIDHFKKINDVHGHLAGDFVLKELARIVQGRIRRDEVFARYGGEEFAIVLPETDARGRARARRELREKIEEHPLRLPERQHPRSRSASASRLLEETDKTIDRPHQARRRAPLRSEASRPQPRLLTDADEASLARVAGSGLIRCVPCVSREYGTSATPERGATKWARCRSANSRRL